MKESGHAICFPLECTIFVAMHLDFMKEASSARILRDQVCIRNFKTGLSFISAIFCQLVSSAITLEINTTRDPAETTHNLLEQHTCASIRGDRDLVLRKQSMTRQYEEWERV